jgi:hypothetical protein
MKAAFVILLAAALNGLLLGQTATTGKASASGICSPATTGNNNTYYFKYCGTDPEQGAKMEELLNKILLNQDTAAANAKLDQILKLLAGLGPPPPRQMTTRNAYAAIALLNTAPKGSRVSISITGGDNEINSFVSQVVQLFNDTRGVWVIADIQRAGMTISMSGDTIYNGSGFHCSASNTASGAGEIAIRALALTGFPCVRDPDSDYSPPPRPPSAPGQPSTPSAPIDLCLSIGTRIVPPN